MFELYPSFPSLLRACQFHIKAHDRLEVVSQVLPTGADIGGQSVNDHKEKCAAGERKDTVNNK